MEASFTARLRVFDNRELKAYARAMNPGMGETPSLEEALSEVVVNPSVAPLDSGFEVTGFQVSALGDNEYLVAVTADVHDAGALCSAAAEGVRRTGVDPDNLGEVLYEHVLGSNASPDPVSLGFEIVERACEGMPLVPAPTP